MREQKLLYHSTIAATYEYFQFRRLSNFLFSLPPIFLFLFFTLLKMHDPYSYLHVLQQAEIKIVVLHQNKSEEKCIKLEKC